MTIWRIWDTYCICGWFHLYNLAVCCIVCAVVQLPWWWQSQNYQNTLVINSVWQNIFDTRACWFCGASPAVHSSAIGPNYRTVITKISNHGSAAGRLSPTHCPHQHCLLAAWSRALSQHGLSIKTPLRLSDATTPSTLNTKSADTSDTPQSKLPTWRRLLTPTEGQVRSSEMFAAGQQIVPVTG